MENNNEKLKVPIFNQRKFSKFIPSWTSKTRGINNENAECKIKLERELCRPRGRQTYNPILERIEMAKRQLYTSVVQCGKYQAPRSSLAPLPPSGYMSQYSIDGKNYMLLILLMVYIRKSNSQSNRITNFPRERGRV